MRGQWKLSVIWDINNDLSLIQDVGDKKPFLCCLLEGRLEAGRLTGAENPAREPTVQSLSVLKLARSFNDGEGRE